MVMGGSTDAAYAGRAMSLFLLTLMPHLKILNILVCAPPSHDSN